MRGGLARASAVLSVFAACNQSIADDVPCHEDGHCPTDYYCTTTGTCRSLEKGSPPDVQFFGVATKDDGEARPSVTIDESRYRRFYLVLHNAGGESISSPEIELTGPHCLHVSGRLASNALLSLDPKETAHVAELMTPDRDCPTPANVDVTIKVGGGSVSPLRITHGRFSVVR